MSTLLYVPLATEKWTLKSSESHLSAVATELSILGSSVLVFKYCSDNVASIPQISQSVSESVSESSERKKHYSQAG